MWQPDEKDGKVAPVRKRRESGGPVLRKGGRSKELSFTLEMLT